MQNPDESPFPNLFLPQCIVTDTEIQIGPRQWTATIRDVSGAYHEMVLTLKTDGRIQSWEVKRTFNPVKIDARYLLPLPAAAPPLIAKRLRELRGNYARLSVEHCEVLILFALHECTEKTVDAGTALVALLRETPHDDTTFRGNLRVYYDLQLNLTTAWNNVATLLKPSGAIPWAGGDH